MSSADVPAGGDSDGAPALSADGRYVAFASHAPDLVEAKTVHGLNVYVRDRVAGTTELVSQATDGTPGNDGASSGSKPAISADGRFVAFESHATNLVAGDTNEVTDIFVRDRLAGTTERASVGAGGVQATVESTDASISGDGGRVAFQSGDEAMAAGAADSFSLDVFVHYRSSGETVLVSPGAPRFGGNSVEPDISADGDFVAFVGPCELVAVGACTAEQAPQIFVRDLQANATNEATFGRKGAANKLNPDITAHGGAVAFEAYGSDLAGDSAGDVYVVDTATKVVARVSVDSSGSPGNASSVSGLQGPAISDDSRKVAYSSFATNLVAGDTNGARDVFVHDLSTAQTTRESVDSAGGQANGVSVFAAISGDGEWVGFVSQASNLVANDPARTDVFVHQLAGSSDTSSTTTTEPGAGSSTSTSSTSTSVAPTTSSTTLPVTTSTTAPIGQTDPTCVALVERERAFGEAIDAEIASLHRILADDPESAGAIVSALDAIDARRLSEVQVVNAALAARGCATS